MVYFERVYIKIFIDEFENELFKKNHISISKLGYPYDESQSEFKKKMGLDIGSGIMRKIWCSWIRFFNTSAMVNLSGIFVESRNTDKITDSVLRTDLQIQ